MEMLGRLVDIGNGWAPVDLDTADGATGQRIAMSGARGISFVVHAAAGAATALTFDVQQHTAYTGGISADLDSAAVASSTGVDHYYIKTETVLDNDESWSRVDQAAASEIALGTADGDNQYILVIEVDSRQLGNGYTHVSLNAAGTLGAPKLASCTYFLHELRFQRKPANLPNLLRPGVSNA